MPSILFARDWTSRVQRQGRLIRVPFLGPRRAEVQGRMAVSSTIATFPSRRVEPRTFVHQSSALEVPGRIRQCQGVLGPRQFSLISGGFRHPWAKIKPISLSNPRTCQSIVCATGLEAHSRRLEGFYDQRRTTCSLGAPTSALILVLLTKGALGIPFEELNRHMSCEIGPS